jgi:hypothetical protein
MDTIRKYLKPKYQDMTTDEIIAELKKEWDTPEFKKRIAKGAKELEKEIEKIKERTRINPDAMNKIIYVLPLINY